MRFSFLRLMIMFFASWVLFGCSETVPMELFDQSVETISISIENEKEYLEQDFEEFMMSTADESKYRYRFVTKLVYDVRTAYEKIYEEVNNLQKELTEEDIDQEAIRAGLKEIVQNIAETNAHILEENSSAMEEHSLATGLSQKVIDQRDQNFQEEVDKRNKEIAEVLNLPATNRKILRGISKMLEFQIVQFEKYVIDFISEVAGVGGGCVFEILFPVVMPQKNCIKSGEYFEAELGIGSYSVYTPEEVTFSVNNDTLKMQENGKAFYRLKTTKPGEIELKMKFLHTNSITGEVLQGEGIYIVDVE